jgi:hypothetical protein
MEKKRTTSRVRVSPVRKSAEPKATLPQSGKDRRSATRVNTHQNAAFGISNVRYVVEARDLSKTGAQICVRRGVVPSAGQLVTLQFMERQPIRAKVVWARDKNVGLEFLQPLPDLPEALHFEDLGMEYFRAILRFQKLAG